MDTTHPLLASVTRALLWCFLLSIVLLLLWGVGYLVIGDWAYGIHSRMFEMTRREFDLIIYCGMGFAKILAFVFFLIPYIALRIVLRGR